MDLQGFVQKLLFLLELLLQALYFHLQLDVLQHMKAVSSVSHLLIGPYIIAHHFLHHQHKILQRIYDHL